MRLRLIIPLTRTVTPDEYAAVSRRVADDLGLARFDPTTFEPARLMYWPSTPEDGEFFFHCEDAPFLDPDEVLKTYADWRDASLWPTTQPVEERIRHTAGKQEDPTEKRGIIGAFCRAHTITDVLTHILPDRYTPTEQDDRYTFIGGSTTGGLVVYDDKYAFSHHATDPAGGKLFLTPEEEKQAEMEQTAALESDVREGMIAEYLNTLLPEDWDKMDLAERRGFLRGDQFTGGNRTGTIQRTTVCAVEIWAECFGKDPSMIKRSDTYDIFGMLMKIGGWEKYSGNMNGLLRRPPYGPQRCYVRK